MKKLKIKVVVTLLFLSGASLLLPAEESAQDALFRAAQSGDVDAAEKALAAGADINGQHPARGETPLIIAAQNRQLNLVNLLLKQGAKVDKREFERSGNRTALMIAAANGDSNIVQKLIQYGADVNAKAVLDYTPLMFAAAGGDAPVTIFLLLNGADLKEKALTGKTALDIARLFNKSAAVQAIENFIAQAAKRREAISQAILKARSETYPEITEEIAEFEI